MKRPRTRRLVLLLPSLAVILAYWQARNFGLVWDDRAYLLEPDFHDWPSLLDWAVTPFMGLYFRPLPLLAIGMETLVSGGAALSHVVSVLIFGLNVALVSVLGWLLHRHFRGDASPGAAITGVIAALLYGLHPAMVETTAWISSRFDLMATLFCLLALAGDRLIGRPGLRALFLALCFVLAACCKEMTLGLALMLPLWHRMLQGSGTGSWMEGLLARRLDYLGIGAAGLAYLAMRQGFSHDLAASIHLRGLALADHLALLCKTLGGFLMATVFPFVSTGPVHPFVPPASFNAPDSLLGCAVLAGTAFLAFDQWRSRRLAPEHLLLACFAVALLPAANLIPLPIGESYFQDRYLAFPLCFGALWVALRLPQVFHAPDSSLPVRTQAAILVTGLWLVMSAACTLTVLPSWRDDLSLWSRATRRMPDSLFVAYNLQNALVQEERYADARELSEQLIRRAVPLPAKLWLLYAQALQKLGEPEKTLQALQQALSAPGGGSPAMQAMIFRQSGLVFLNAGQFPQAQAHLQKSFEYDPEDPEAPYYLAVLYFARGDAAEGRRHLDISLKHASPALAVQLHEHLDASVGTIRKQLEEAAQGR